ncbi:Acyl-CoA carboxylase epsilon subunit [Streptomyces sp. DvalAA-14]|uniref:acyl-CoA carboxylase subunit epsilon n=1 Tax=unclassified Streptomyces TaxID=2593676 RepID=UPI00081B5AE7|nr:MULTISPECIES: acyl-CoA carboxylase subunit epsilon [unclassified Streptomyces]MYS19331.1 acyl-CoA carboxylase subunit epsilon [Streptomyces sp. SID4948]SCD41968.1 Acyl-CoA carboxylase epsilon subunit [Streptomyces sp. DvalAA-14]
MTESNDLRLLRVERGNPSAEELAALITALLGRTAVGERPPAAADRAPAPRWRRPERVHLFDAPRVWRAYQRVGD